MRSQAGAQRDLEASDITGSRLVTLGKDVIAFVLNKINALSGGELTIAAVFESARTFKKVKKKLNMCKHSSLWRNKGEGRGSSQ